MQLFVNSENLIQIKSLKDPLTGLVVSGATATASVLNSVSGTSYVSTPLLEQATLGNYAGYLARTSGIVRGGYYTLEIIIDAPGGKRLTKRESCDGVYST